MTRLHNIAIAALASLAVLVSARAESIHVAPTGDDSAAGSASAPVATPHRAQELARKLIAAGLKEDLTVVLHGGTYYLPRPLSFGPGDGGSDDGKGGGRRVTWTAAPNERVILSGGRRIAGFAPAGTIPLKAPATEAPADKKAPAAKTAALYQVDLGDVKAGRWDFRQLWVDGRRAVRARTPDMDADPRYDRLLGAELKTDLSAHALKMPKERLAKWANLGDVEVIVLNNWATCQKRAESVDVDAGTVALAGPHAKYFSSNRPRKGNPFFLENAREFLDSRGEWYLDRKSGVLTYCPREGEDLARCEVIAPVLTRLVEIAGTQAAAVRNLHLRGLALLHSDLPPAEGGHEGRQACFRYGGDKVSGSMPAAVTAEHAVGWRIVECEIAHLGGSAVLLRDGCHRNVMEGNRVHDVEGNGLGVGGPNDDTLAPRGNRISNNHVHHCGVRYLGAVGIWVGFAPGTIVSHNLVHDLPYTGISVGWQWNALSTVNAGHLIDDNHIFDVMKEVSDGGGIYTLGFQPGTRIRGNWIHDVQRSPFAHAAPNNGIFFDEGSKGFAVERNTIYRTSGKPIRFNQCQKDWHSWKENVLLEDPAAEPPATHPAKDAGLEKAWRKLVQ